MRDPTAEKGVGKTALLSAPSVSLNARLRGWACPCPALRGRGAGLHFKGVSPAPQTRWSQGLPTGSGPTSAARPLPAPPPLSAAPASWPEPSPDGGGRGRASPRTANPARQSGAETVPGSPSSRARRSQVGEAEAPPTQGEEASPPPLASSFAAPDGGWLSADESSGYESESAGGEPPRRARTAFTSEQVCRLEKTFQRQKYLGASERRKLAAALQLSEIQIKTWFQNRRMKLKRQIQDRQHGLVSPAPLYSYSLGTPPALLQDALHYPFAPQHQRLLPFTPVPAVQFSFSFPRYDASQSTYRFMANELPYYHQHILPHHFFHPIIQSKMDKQCHPVYAL
uniref:Homeobox domain-containing protein n=1 Tax=Otus sunia TaxID=257818 RepID=A0A8C8E9C7_9STRI